MTRPTRRQLEAARATLLAVYELPNTTGSERDAISETREVLAELLEYGLDA